MDGLYDADMPPPERDVVVSIPADAGFVHVLRAVTSAIAARLDLPIDDLEDLRLAIDEASAYLLASGDGSERLVLTLGGTSSRVEALIARDGGRDVSWPPEQLDHSFAWQVMSTLSDEVNVERYEGRPAIRIVKGTGEGRDA